nr:PLP-dependent transferase [Actinomycetota bacterium]
MIEPDGHRFDTRALHAGQRPDPVTGSRAVPIHQTTSFVFDSVDHASGLFNLEISGHLYSRISNPTVAGVEERSASLCGGVGGGCTAHCQARGHRAVVLWRWGRVPSLC